MNPPDEDSAPLSTPSTSGDAAVGRNAPVQNAVQAAAAGTDSASLVGKRIMVTGASSGIGRAIAYELARAGADLVLHARASRDRLEETAGEVRRLGRKCSLHLADLADAATLEPLVEAAWNAFGTLDGWVNNAGADLLTGAPAKWSFEQKLEHLLQVDVAASLRLSRLAGRRMQAVGSGAIVNIGWDQAWQGMAGDSGELFACSKGAVMAFSKSLALSLAPTVRVNCVAPGWIRTAWGEGAPQAWQQRAVRECALGRWGEPADVAAVVRFLLSPAAGFVTGQILPVNGGWKAF